MADSKAPDQTPNTADLGKGNDTPLQGKRIDQTVPGGHYVVNDRHVDANGNEVNEDGSPKAKDGK